ncbi:LLM class flavin-dependent oxidoreductase [Paraburkholderia phenoliruptrix]|uniref:LLM class flavin-dependent oxidoreductase n=1 Tax=Paraburkholderia phenoliruptrix TaxID=252970 RepID=A0ABV3WHM7_9BURK|nr:LLM class flavin-dependent oxidoreductase [Paraburkholderia phenoliruptrix]MDR6392495.1 FMN-dependent oxidoreductase (nitrilotriacetate monooxygenase family) [Paraburkholderia phenoliruptrix]
MHLGAFLYPTGYHVAGWRHPGAQADAGVNFEHYGELACRAEAAHFDLLFLADSLAIRGDDIEALERTAIRYVAQFEPLTLISGLAARTRRIGLIASASTTYNEPYHIARKFGSLDHISGGRAGWNLITSQNEYEAFNFGMRRHPSHAERYARASEFVDVVQGLWDSWEDDAFLRDKSTGLFFDRTKLHPLRHEGEHFQVRGPLNIPRSPQGAPVLVQAGASEAGRALAARSAELVFCAQNEIHEAKAFYRDMRERLAACGRRDGSLKIMVGVFPYVGRSLAEAEDKYEALQQLVHPVSGLSLLSAQLGGFDLSHVDLDGPLPEIPETEAGQSRRQLLIDMARREELSVRQLYQRIAGGRGHWQLVGTPESICDELEQWFNERASDGFNVMPPYSPAGLYDFIDMVVPELVRRGLFRDSYRGNTLRSHLGLDVPSNRFARR